MPNYGRSGRCLTCKRRRVKCDETRPACSPCRRLGLDCEGYTKSYVFRDQNHKFTSTTSLKVLRERCSSLQCSVAAEEPSRSLLTGADVAVPFFLLHYAGTGRILAAARGFYETLIPMSNAQPQDSPLSLAISAVATKTFSFWRHEDACRIELHSAPYAQAVASLRSALKSPEERCKPATALAVLALHLYESISAIYDARQAMPVHHHGALSLLPIAALDSLDDLISTYAKGFVLHTEISSALRQKRFMHPSACSYVKSPGSSPLVPGNFSSTLDSIGASLAELQAHYMQGLSQEHDSNVLQLQKCRDWITEAGKIDELLLAWARDVPVHWRPLRLTSGQGFSLSITVYQSACDIYPSCQIATLWNLWRFHRLLLLKITLGARQRISTLPRDDFAGVDPILSTTMNTAADVSSIQDIVDGVCHSVPFYLGNRTKPSSLNDFADSEILLPSYHSLTPDDPRAAAMRQDCIDVAFSRDEHHRHIIAYGAWHILSPLSNLLTLVQDDYGGQIVASCLRPGQLEWVREQFLRVSILIRLPFARTFGGQKGSSPPFSSVDPNSADIAAEALAKQVRKGTMFMSGP